MPHKATWGHNEKNSGELRTHIFTPPTVKYMFTHVTMVLFIVNRGVIVPKFDRKLKYLSNFPSKGPYYNCNNDI